MADCNCCQDLTNEEYAALGETPSMAQVLDALRQKRQHQKLIESEEQVNG